MRILSFLALVYVVIDHITFFGLIVMQPQAMAYDGSGARIYVYNEISLSGIWLWYNIWLGIL